MWLLLTLEVIRFLVSESLRIPDSKMTSTIAMYEVHISLVEDRRPMTSLKKDIIAMYEVSLVRRYCNVRSRRRWSMSSFIAMQAFLW